MRSRWRRATGLPGPNALVRVTVAGQRRTFTGFAFQPCHPGHRAPPPSMSGSDVTTLHPNPIRLFNCKTKGVRLMEPGRLTRWRCRESNPGPEDSPQSIYRLSRCLISHPVAPQRQGPSGQSRRPLSPDLAASVRQHPMSMTAHPEDHGEISGRPWPCSLRANCL